MPPFPYLPILKQAYRVTRRYPFLWIFGLFIGGSAGLNFGGVNFFFSPSSSQDLEQAKKISDEMQQWISQNSELFTLIIAGILLVFLFLVIAQGLAKAAVICTVPQARARQVIDFKTALKNSRKYFWRIIGLQILITLGFFLFLVIFALPIGYLFSLGATGRALFLTLLAAAIFIPTLVVLGFLHLYGPIFIVLFDQNIKGALLLSFNLVWRKLKESIILSAFLIGIGFVFFVALGSSLILWALPVALMGLLLVYLGFKLALTILLAGAVIIAIIYLMVLAAAFAVFQNIAWVLAVEEMIRTLKVKEEAPSLAVEPA